MHTKTCSASHIRNMNAKTVRPLTVPRAGRWEAPPVDARRAWHLGVGLVLLGLAFALWLQGRQERMQRDYEANRQEQRERALRGR